MLRRKWEGLRRIDGETLAATYFLAIERRLEDRTHVGGTSVYVWLGTDGFVVLA